MVTRFRADHVGSLLRPAALLEARTAYAEGRLGAEALRQADYIDPVARERLRASGVDPDQILGQSVAADNACVAGLARPGVTLGLQSAVATAAVAGMRRAATSRLPSGCSSNSRRRPPAGVR